VDYLETATRTITARFSQLCYLTFDFLGCSDTELLHKLFENKFLFWRPSLARSFYMTASDCSRQMDHETVITTLFLIVSIRDLALSEMHLAFVYCRDKSYIYHIGIKIQSDSGLVTFKLSTNISSYQLCFCSRLDINA
jgi:hypothetical protein